MKSIPELKRQVPQQDPFEIHTPCSKASSGFADGPLYVFHEQPGIGMIVQVYDKFTRTSQILVGVMEVPHPIERRQSRYNLAVVSVAVA